jgi:adenylate kinase
MNLLVLGPQGSGKGTQAKRVSAELAIPHVSTGDMLRAAIAEESDLGLQVKAVLHSGKLVSDELTNDLVEERLARPDVGSGFVLDGYPRNPAQGEALDAMLERLGRGAVDLVLFFDLSDEIATARMLARAKAEGRADDTPEVIARRLEIYHAETEPLVARYRGRGILVHLQAERTIDEVYAQIREAIGRRVSGDP